MAHSLTEANAALASAHSRDQRHKQTIQRLEAALVRKVTGTVLAGTYGAMKRAAVPNTIKGFPWKLGTWTLFQLAEALTSGMVQAAAGAMADATMHVYTHDAVAGATLIAGEGGEL